MTETTEREQAIEHYEKILESCLMTEDEREYYSDNLYYCLVCED